LASHYDEERFANAYGCYVDAQERRVLKRWFAGIRNEVVLDLACGTGRLLDLATHGLDASEEMVRIAHRKYPQKQIWRGRAEEVAQLGIRFDAIFCLHLFMHLALGQIEGILRACRAQLRPGGLFIFDAPSALRRNLTGFLPEGWHGATALTLHEVASISKDGWRQRSSRGVMFFPIHRVPPAIRPFLRPWDDLIGMTHLKHLSSYVVYCLERRP
jgi:2-polyprenyl-3-methyl-5-hydroxy-6-metoxy-1,4-benzoquinol methylase